MKKSGEQCEVEVCETTVPMELYKDLLRGTPDYLKKVCQQSGAQVKVLMDSESSGGQREVRLQLQGSEQQVLLARCVLDGLVINSKPVSEVLEVPFTSVGRIIGRGGENVKMITRITGASVSCSSQEGPEAKGRVSISGTRSEVEQAKELVLEKVNEDTEVRARISQSSAQRHKRGAPGNRKPKTDAPTPCLNNNGPLSISEDPEVPQSTNTKGPDFFQKMEKLKISQEDSVLPVSPQSPQSPHSDMSKFEIPSPDLSFQPDKHFEVYVSAVENPNHFWIQILGVRSLQLDQLTADMGTFYKSDITKQRVEALVVGDIVAAPYKDHGTWNRARVLGVLASGLVDLYYVDYGDNSELPRDALRPMRSDFLSLPFQAIECSLAGVKPQGDVWTEEALLAFEDLTHCALWKPLQARLCSYSHCEATSWPSVRLYDASEDKSLDVGEELIRMGHATANLEPLNGLQKMLDDVMGASSELSLSCISLSEAASISGSIDDVIEDHLL